MVETLKLEDRLMMISAWSFGFFSFFRTAWCRNVL